jgi:riboflavin kinase/FMN adenylyltransferase
MLIHSLDSNFNFKNPVVTIGTFDGVHKGHRAVISHLMEKARSINGESVVITFFPHPRQILSENIRPPSLLNTSDEKKTLLEKSGIDHLIIIDFDRELSMMEACDFVKDVLVKKIGAKHLIVGFNHHFGRRGDGDFNTIKQCAGRFKITVEMVEAISSDSGTISSSLIRDALIEGRLEDANTMLGYSYSLTGKIVAGRKIGREIGFPTANILPFDPEKLVPGNGVYAVEILIGKEEYKGVMNIGFNPTIRRDSSNRTIEVNIFNFENEVYGSEITIIFRYRLRGEIVFAGLDELAAQIAKDKIKAISLLG